MKCIYNFVMVAGDKVLDTIKKLHFQWINPAVMMVKPTYFGCVSLIDYELPWVKCCLIIGQYLCEESGYVRIGRMVVCGAIPEHKIKKLAGDEGAKPFLKSVETFCRDAVQRYDYLPEYERLQTFASLFQRVGSLVGSLPSTSEQLAEKLALIEAKFRAFVRKKYSGTEMPPPVCADVLDEVKTDKVSRSHDMSGCMCGLV